MSPPPTRNVLIVPLLAVAFAGLTVVGQPACGRSDVDLVCVAFRYTVEPNLPSGKLSAVFDPLGDLQAFAFDPPSLIVNAETHELITADSGSSAAIRLREILADATRELCRRTLEAGVAGFDYRTDASNCDQPDYHAEQIGVTHEMVTDEDFDDEEGPSVMLNPACFGACLLEECSTDDTGGYDPAPDHPFIRTVHCQCHLEVMGTCSPSDVGEFPDAMPVTEDFCVPEDENSPAEYCRLSVADYLNASIRAINHYGGVAPFGGYVGTCGSFGPEDYGVVVRCRPILEEDIEIETDAIEAYTEQSDACAPGCSNLVCDDLQNDNLVTRPCTIMGDPGCFPQICSLEQTCDCDLLPEPCFENEVINGVCLPEMVGGADDGSDDGGGSARLRSAINLLTGTWLDVGDDFACSQLEPGGSVGSYTGNPAPSGGVSPYTLTNGTSYGIGLQVTCPAPTTDEVAISTFGTTLEELCRLIPLCNGSSELELSITASEDETPLASGSLDKAGEAITAVEDGAPLSVGDHTVDLCVEHEPSEVVACSEQSIRAAAPLGSGVDGFGYFAGEVALDFVSLASKSGAQELSLTDDGIAEVRLPSGFHFPFYGLAIHTIYVGTNGGINTTNRAIAAANTALPAASNTDSPDIAVYWDDLDLTLGGGVYTWFDGTRFIVSWEDVHHACEEAETCDANDGIRVQAHIYASGRIELHYLDTSFRDFDYDSGASATIGIGDITWTDAVEVSYDSSTLLGSSIAAIGFSLEGDGCLADTLVVPPQVACTASDHYTTVCTPSDETVTLPLPYVELCAYGSAGVVGEVIESGSDESSLVPLATPIPIDEYGDVELDEGVHRVRWWPADGEGDHVGPAFTQLVFVRTWVHDECGANGRTLVVLTQSNDTYTAEPGITPLAIIGRFGQDVITTSLGDDFIGDGPGDGICEADDGNDLLVGEDGDDTLDGAAGNDRIWGGAGNDLLIGGDDADMLDGQDDRDILQGNDGDDELWGGLEDDELEGGDGADTLMPGSGVDFVYGGGGNDAIVILAACELTEGKYLSGGSGTDTLYLPPDLDLVDVENAGVIVDEDIESVQRGTDLPIHRAACEPS